MVFGGFLFVFLTKACVFFSDQVGGLDGHVMPINHIAFSPNGRQLVTVSDDQRVKVRLLSSVQMCRVISDILIHSPPPPPPPDFTERRSV